MNEIEKLMQNAGIKKQIPKVCSSNELYCKECEAHIENAMPYCKNAEYPTFTAEKQLELIKWLIINRGFKPDYDEKEWGFCTYYIGGYYRETFEEALANLLNELWQSLTKEEKEQIRDILKG